MKYIVILIDKLKQSLSKLLQKKIKKFLTKWKITIELVLRCMKMRLLIIPKIIYQTVLNHFFPKLLILRPCETLFKFQTSKKPQ